MLAEGLNQLKQMIAENDRCGMLDIDPDNDRFAFIFDSVTGEMQAWAKPPRPISLTFFDLQSLALSIFDTHLGSSVWVSETHVHAVYGGESTSIDLRTHQDRRDRGRIDLGLSPLFHVIKCLKSMKPADLIRSLKFDLYTADISPTDLILRFAKLKFESGKTLESDINHGDEAVSGSIKRSVTCAGDLPQTCVFSFSAYPQLPELTSIVSIDCMVEVNIDAGTISIVPFPGELDAALHLCRRTIFTRLAELIPADQALIYCGSP